MSKLHPSLAASALENIASLFKPHPPQLLGLVMVSHFTHANKRLGWCPFHRNLQHMLWSLFRMPLGIQIKDIQYTRVASSTAFMRTNLLALDRYFSYHMLSLFSNLDISHVQSDI